MTIDAAHRSSIYQKLVPVLGAEDANVLMSEFPALEADELVTRDHLRAELAILRGEVGQLGSDLRAEMGELRSEMGDLRTELRTSMASLETRMTTRLGAVIGASTAVLAGVGMVT